MGEKYFAGIDVGASAVKVVIINDKKEIKAHAIHKSGVNLINSAQSALDQAKSAISSQPIAIERTVSTGFGRNNLPFAQKSITEISAHSKGVYYFFPMALTIIDIGAQDNKIIRINDKGHLVNFKMNRKCAAGTGVFLEEIAYKMDIPLNELNGLGKQSDNPVELGSYCTVFTGTEILSRIREGRKKEDIVRGVFGSVVKRIIEMDPLEDTWAVPLQRNTAQYGCQYSAKAELANHKVAITGGVIAHNDIILDLLRIHTKKEILIPRLAQFTGALGAALSAMESE